MAYELVEKIAQQCSPNELKLIVTFAPLLQLHIDENNSRGSSIFGLLNLLEEHMSINEMLLLTTRFLYHNQTW